MVGKHRQSSMLNTSLIAEVAYPSSVMMLLKLCEFFVALETGRKALKHQRHRIAMDFRHWSWNLLYAFWQLPGPFACLADGIPRNPKWKDLFEGRWDKRGRKQRQSDSLTNLVVQWVAPGGVSKMPCMRVLRSLAWNNVENKIPDPSGNKSFPFMLMNGLACCSWTTATTCWLQIDRFWFHFWFRPEFFRDDRFAGPDNFCPVLVGSLGGALFGCDMATAWWIQDWEWPGRPWTICISRCLHTVNGSVAWPRTTRSDGESLPS